MKKDEMIKVPSNLQNNPARIKNPIVINLYYKS